MPGSYPCLHSHVKDPTVLTQPAPPVPQALSTSLHSSTSTHFFSVSCLNPLLQTHM